MGSVCSLSMRSMLHARWLEKTLSALYLAGPYRCLQGARRGSTLENAAGWFRRFFCFSTPILLRYFGQKKLYIIPPPFSQCRTRVAIAEQACTLLLSRWKKTSPPPTTSTDSLFSCAVCRPCILPVRTTVCRGPGRAVLCKMQGGMI